MSACSATICAPPASRRWASREKACVAFAAGHTWEASARVFAELASNVRFVEPDNEPAREVAEFVAEDPHFAVTSR